MNDLKTKMADLRGRIKALQSEYAVLLAEKKRLARRKYVCITTGCLNITSKKTILGKWGERYKQCDECRRKAALKWRGM